MINLIKKLIRKTKTLFTIYKFKRRYKKYAEYIMKQSFCETATGECLDRIAELNAGCDSFCRMGWYNKEDIPKDQPYFLNPFRMYIGEPDYLETDASLRKRILEKMNERRATR